MDTTILKGLTVLEKLAESDRPRGVTELSRQMNLTKSNVQRLLSTLVELGYAQKDQETGRYGPTLRMWEFGYKALSRDRVRLAAAPYLKNLFEQCGETVFLCAAEGTDVVYVDKIEGIDSSGIFCMVGMRMPALKTAAGRAVLAFQANEIIDRALAVWSTETLQPALDSDDVKRKLGEIREAGYATSVGEFRPGVNSIAAPIWGADGKAVASVVINGPADRLSTDRLQSLVVNVTTIAVQISEALGFRLA
ncbi:IclR family transcriptional regulator [Paraburkholderia sediminicola]|uniref:IclR family transcriptional regulator n=1 Tax=Paraburkholderia sediminicola TaxID=458836 RepID=UPI0038B7B358